MHTAGARWVFVELQCRWKGQLDSGPGVRAVIWALTQARILWGREWWGLGVVPCVLPKDKAGGEGEGGEEN